MFCVNALLSAYSIGIIFYWDRKVEYLLGTSLCTLVPKVASLYKAGTWCVCFCCWWCFFCCWFLFISRQIWKASSKSLCVATFFCFVKLRNLVFLFAPCCGQGGCIPSFPLFSPQTSVLSFLTPNGSLSFPLLPSEASRFENVWEWQKHAFWRMRAVIVVKQNVCVCLLFFFKCPTCLFPVLRDEQIIRFGIRKTSFFEVGCFGLLSFFVLCTLVSSLKPLCTLL